MVKWVRPRGSGLPASLFIFTSVTVFSITNMFIHSINRLPFGCLHVSDMTSAAAVSSVPLPFCGRDTLHVTHKRKRWTTGHRQPERSLSEMMQDCSGATRSIYIPNPSSVSSCCYTPLPALGDIRLSAFAHLKCEMIPTVVLIYIS